MSRARILTLFLALIALASAFAACGGGGSDSPQAVVDEATLQGIESGDIDLALGIDVKGEKSGHVDVSLSGPFQSESEAELPEFDLTATAKGSLGGEDIDFDGGFTLLGGNKAYVGYEGSEYEVDPTTFSFVKSALEKQSGGQSERSNRLHGRGRQAEDLRLHGKPQGRRQRRRRRHEHDQGQRRPQRLGRARHRQRTDRRPGLQRTAGSGRPASLRGRTGRGEEQGAGLGQGRPRRPLRRRRSHRAADLRPGDDRTAGGFRQQGRRRASSSIST